MQLFHSFVEDLLFVKYDSIFWRGQFYSTHAAPQSMLNVIDDISNAADGGFIIPVDIHVRPVAGAVSWMQPMS